MPKFYLRRAAKIPTAVHPFVKQTIPQDKHKPRLLLGKIIRGMQNIAMSMYGKIYTALALLVVSIADCGRLRHRSSDSRRATSKPLARLQK
ncbi:MAG: hypothetical protein V7K21_14740 [Nostoc sp.]|uniref:hypothetical protein n=1 Tax=Nostoc sp. TaxID=1180 RepID=UPI002FF68BDB